MALTDAALIARVVVDDDRDAFHVLVLRHQSSVRMFLGRLTCGDKALADDLAQETFLRAYRGMRGFHGGAKLSTWLCQIAYRAFLDQARRLRESPWDTDDASRWESELGKHEQPLAEGSQPDERAILRRDLLRGFRLLTEAERAAISLAYGDGLSHPEAAAVLGCPIGTLKSHIVRALEKLARSMRSYRPEESP